MARFEKSKKDRETSKEGSRREEKMDMSQMGHMPMGKVTDCTTCKMGG